MIAAEDAARCRLYLITPPAFELDAFSPLLAATLDAGDVACVQLRLKTDDDAALRRACTVLAPVCQDRDVAFLVNDRADVAAECGADGVHIGQEDTDYVAARRLVGDDAVVGVTCHHSRDLAIAAAEAGADYVAFGAFFPTGTKIPKSQAEPEILRWWSEMTTVPCVAIGGITVENCPVLVEAGADFLAVVAGVWDYADGPAAAVRVFNKITAQTVAR